jgi:hypothetical protein
MAASTAPTRPPDLAEWAKSRLYKIAHPTIFGAVMPGSRRGFRVVSRFASATSGTIGSSVRFRERGKAQPQRRSQILA